MVSVVAQFAASMFVSTLVCFASENTINKKVCVGEKGVAERCGNDYAENIFIRKAAAAKVKGVCATC